MTSAYSPVLQWSTHFLVMLSAKKFCEAGQNLTQVLVELSANINGRIGQSATHFLVVLSL